MGKFLDGLKSDSVIGEVMRSRCEKTIKLRKRQIELEKRIKADSVLQDHINENVLSVLDAQKVANLICQQKTLVSLVKEMRDAQKAYENAPKKTMEDVDALETYIFEMLEAEKKVDNLLKNIEEII